MTQILINGDKNNVISYLFLLIGYILSIECIAILGYKKSSIPVKESVPHLHEINHFTKTEFMEQEDKQEVYKYHHIHEPRKPL